MNNKILFLILLGLVMFGIRLFNLNENIYDDESNFSYTLTVMDGLGFNHYYYSPQPLNFLYKPLIVLFGLKTWVFRLIPWLFGILNTLLVYIFARRNYGEKTAFFAVLLMLVSFYPTLAALQFDVEGNLIMFCALLLFLSYLEYEKSEQFAWQILAGIALGIMVITKYNAVYMVIALALYSLVQRKWQVKQSIKDLFPVYLVGFLLFACYIFVAIIASPENWLDFVGIISPGRYYASHFSLLGLAMFVVWSTPLLVGFYLLALARWDKRNLLLVLWITMPIFFYTFLITSGSMDRYFMNTIPALALLGGYFLSQEIFQKKHIVSLALLVAGMTLLFFLLNTIPIKYVARFPELYLKEITQGNLFFLFSYTSASGPMLGISFVTIFVSFFLGFAFLLLCILFFKMSLRKWFLILFLALSVAFNVFLMSEYIFHPTGVDVSSVKWEMLNYFQEHHLPYPVYSNDQGLQWYIDPRYWHNYDRTIGFGDNEIGDPSTLAKKSIAQRGGTILLLRWPPLPEESPAWEVNQLCQRIQQFFSKRHLIGEIYLCR